MTSENKPSDDLHQRMELGTKFLEPSFVKLVVFDQAVFSFFQLHQLTSKHIYIATFAKINFILIPVSDDGYFRKSFLYYIIDSLESPPAHSGLILGRPYEYIFLYFMHSRPL